MNVAAAHTYLDSGGLDALAVYGVPTTEVDGIHCQLVLDTRSDTCTTMLEHQIVIPPHKVAEPKVMQPAGTNRPKTVGSTHGTRMCLEYSLEVRSCKNSRLGRKKSQDANDGCVRNNFVQRATDASEKSLREMSSATMFKSPGRCWHRVWMREVRRSSA